MKACPNCGNEVGAETAVCECGELLRAEVTHVQAWETETVFGTRPAPARKRKFAGMIALVVGLAIVGFAWIGIRQDLTSAAPEPNAQPSTSQTQDPSASDQPEELTSTASSQAGVFVFSPGNRAADPGKIVHAKYGKAGAQTSTPDAPSSGSLDSKLDHASSVPATTTDKPKPDCKPDIALKRAEPPAPPADQKPAAPKTTETSRTYILGPRGGCFFVTPGGGKKYVDRGLCSLSTTVGARQ
jgi:hypothetical protein